VSGQPKSGLLSRLSPEDFEAFYTHLGWLIFKSVPAAAFARHKRPLNTIRDYLDVLDNDPEPIAMAKRFIHDILTGKNTDELAESWFGADASLLAAQVSEDL
jgi:hypothetical protein